MKYAFICLLLLVLMPFAVPMMFVMVAASLIGGLYLIFHELFVRQHQDHMHLK